MPCRSCGGTRRIVPRPNESNTAPQTAEQIVARMPRRPTVRPSSQFTGKKE